MSSEATSKGGACLPQMGLVGPEPLWAAGGLRQSLATRRPHSTTSVYTTDCRQPWGPAQPPAVLLKPSPVTPPGARKALVGALSGLHLAPWEHPGSLASVGERDSVGATPQVSTAEVADAASYMCVAENLAGSVEKLFTLRVQGEPAKGVPPP